MATDPNLMIAELLVVTGWNQQIEDIPKQTIEKLTKKSPKENTPLIRMP